VTRPVGAVPAYSPSVPMKVMLDSRARSEIGATGPEQEEFRVLGLMALSDGQHRYLVFHEGMMQPRWVDPHQVMQVVLA
jgi:hypothetical protein